MSKFKRRTKLSISDWMAISHPRSIKKCCFCGERINGVGIIIYLNHKTFTQYAWVHLPCLKEAKPSKLRQSLFFYTREDVDVPILSAAYGCSYCGVKNQEIPILNFNSFYLHPKCVGNAYKVAYGVFLDNQKELLAKMI